MTTIIKLSSAAIMVLLLIVAPLVARAQHPAIKDYYKQHEAHENVHHIVLEGGLFKMLTWFAALDENDQEAQAFKRIVNNIEGFDIVVVPKGLQGNYTFADVQKQVQDDRYQELMNVRDENSKIKIYAQGKDKEVRDMVIFVDDQNEYCIISLKGILNMEDLKYLASNHQEFRY